MKIFTAWLAGLLMGWGMLVSGMSNPAKVLGFLDLAGPWDPSLALVMAGAVAVAWAGYRWLKTRKQSALGEPLRWPLASVIDRRLVLGSLLFGAGWGLAGFCPGPALVVLSYGGGPALTFVLAMLVGMGLFELIERARSPR